MIGSRFKVKGARNEMNSGIDLEEIKTVACLALKLPEAVSLYVESIKEGGSARSYYRVRYGEDDLHSHLRGNDKSLSTMPGNINQEQNKKNRRTVILMKYDRAREENNYYAAIAKFLAAIGVRTPRILHDDPMNNFIVMEDLGDKDLWSLRNESWNVRRDCYFKTLGLIHVLHCYPVEHFSSEGVTLMEGFGPDLYRWEHAYFMDNFVEAVCHIETDRTVQQLLEDELSQLAERLEQYPKCLVHRDFQSQNVMIYESEPVLIDFQGMRFGNLFYDLASLLYDPYCDVAEGERMELLRYYYDIEKRDPDWEDFEKMFRLAAAQRLMQALGAYGHLGIKQQKNEFLKHIPNGLNNLIDAVSHSRCLPQLENLCRRCLTTLKAR
jgi:aminoglycoside/choline kinase family phosphotransferase